MTKKVLCSMLLGLTALSLFAGDPWRVSWQPSKAFIENRGQFPKVNNRDILFAADQDRTKIYFSATGLTYAFFKSMPEREENEAEREREMRERAKNGESWEELEKEERSAHIKRDYVHLTWANANPNAQIEGSNKVQEYFSYALMEGSEVNNINFIPGFKKITYKNLYPNIDVEYIFHPAEGLKYALILHPGADISQVQMVFSDADKVSIYTNGDLHIKTEFGDIIDHAPETFYQASKSPISSKFTKKGKNVGFELENYNSNEAVVIDPWTITPTIPNSNGVWECEKDGSGNVYIIGGDSPMRLLKYNSAGVLQWNYNTTWDTANYWLGTFVTDLAGNSYVTAGSTARLQKVNTSGSMLYNVAGGSMDEYWNIAFNCDQTKLIIGGTRLVGIPQPTGNGTIFDINTATGAVNSIQNVGKSRAGFLGVHDPEEVRAITSSYNARYYFLTLDSIGAIDQNFSSCSGSGQTNTLFNFNHTYSFGYKCEDWRPQGNGGIMAIRANNKFVYTQNGTTISKRSLMTGAVITTATIPGGISTANLGFNSPGNSGIDIDSCGNVYVGSGNAVLKYDANLNLLSTSSVPFHVYDVAVSYGGNVIACGATGTYNTTSRTGYVESFALSACNPMTLSCCDANVCAAGPFCTTSPAYTLSPVTPGGTWSGTGVNSSGVFDPSVAGAGTHTIVYSLACGSDSLNIVVSACASLSVCKDNSGNLTVSGGTPGYTWQTQTTVTTCTACLVGCTIPPGCQQTVTSWSTVATNTATVTPPSYPIRVTDNAGNSYTVTTANSVPNCTVSCVPPTVSVVGQTNVSCFGGSNGTATVTATPVGTYTYTWQNGNLNGASQSGLSAGVYTVSASDGGSCLGTTTVSITQPPSLTVTAAQTASVTCSGLSNGSASVSVSGGTPSYTVNWSNGTTGTTDSNLPAGTYTATATDANGCTATNTVTIIQPLDIHITSQGTSAALCGSSNGSATVSANGGTPSYTYSWSTGATGQVLSGVPGGTYTITVTDANGCTNQIAINISSVGGPTVTAAQTASVTCNGLSNGTASVNISGGTPSYTVNWSSGSTGTTASGLSAGTYTAVITDSAGCVSTDTVTISEPPPIAITFTNNSPSACALSTGSVTANASGGTGTLTYTWNTGASGQTLGNVSAGTYTVTVTDINNCSQSAPVTISTVNGPSVTPAVTATVACNGGSTGSASVSVSGGTPSYTVAWSNGSSGTTATGLPAGLYTVTVTDAASCITTDTISISQPPAITLTVNSSPTGCVGSTGSATVSANGGTPTYTYTWSNSQTGTTATGLGAGVYTVTATDANNCPATQTVSIAVSNAPVLAIDSTHNVLCSGQSNGSATVSANGGTPTYTYTWSNSQSGTTASNLGQGTYTVTVLDAAGCKDSTTVSITQPAVLTSTVGNIQPENCNHQNGSATVNAGGGTSPYSYQWSSGQTSSAVNNFPAGTYSVVITDAHGCKDTSTATITNIPGPTVSLTGQTNVICNGLSTGSATASATGGTPSYTYTWSNGASGTAATGLSAGVYTVTVSDSALCTSTMSVTITQPPAIQIGNSASLPPCNGGSNGSASISNISGGASPYTITWSNGQTGATATNLPAGNYTATVTDNNGCKDTSMVAVVDAAPNDSLDITGTLCAGDPVILLTGPNGTGIIAPYQWYDASVAVPGATSYTYSANSSAYNNVSVSWFHNGCRYITTNEVITIAQDFGTLPQTNVFTPNEDHANDEFLPFSLTGLSGNVSVQLLATMIEDYELDIYDRWGILLFKTTQVTDTWNGKTSSGKNCDDGTYFWIAKFKAKCSKNSGEQNIKGFVQLIR